MNERGCIVIGSGGHAKVVIELLRDSRIAVSYCIGTANDPRHCLDVSVLVGDENIEVLRRQGYSKAFVAIGDNYLREKLALIAEALGYELVNAISPKAVVSPSATLGKGIAIMAGAVVNADTRIEDFSIINTGATVDHDCRIGYASHIAPQCALAGHVEVGSKTFLGVGCKIIPNVKIGDAVIIGAGSLVIQDIPTGVKAYGTPATIAP